jgi:hypothetical protein
MSGPLKEAMGGKKFRSDEEVQQAVHEHLRRQKQEFFSRGIHTLCKGGGPVLNDMENL